MASSVDNLMIAERLRNMSRDGGSIDAAQVKLIGLDEIRRAAGARWPLMRERVRTGSLEILSRYTRAEDVIIPAGDGFLIVLAEGPPGNAQKCCQRMREALLSFYLGDEALARLRPELTAHALNVDGFADLLASNMQRETGERALVAKAYGQDIAVVRLFAPRQQKIVAELCAPVHKDHLLQRRLAYNADFLLDGRHVEPDYLELDFAILDFALARSQDPARTQGVLGITVHASTLQRRRSREVYLKRLASVSDAFRHQAFVIVAEIQRGTPLMSIAEWSSMLRALVARVGLDFHYTDHAVTSVGATGAWAVGFHLPIYAGAQKGPRAAKMLDQLTFWARTIHSQNMRLEVNGFVHPEFLQAANRIGVDLVTSDTLWPFRFANDAAARPSTSSAAASG